MTSASSSGSKNCRAWASCNFAEICLFDRADEQTARSSCPSTPSGPIEMMRAPTVRLPSMTRPLAALVERLCEAAGQEPSARDAPHLATLMAHSARLVRGIVRDRLAELHAAGNPDHALLQVRQEFRDVLYAHPEAAGYSATDFDELFSAAFAQTLAFGLLLVREGTGYPAGPSLGHMPEEHPLMRTALRVLSLESGAGCRCRLHCHVRHRQ